MGHVGQWQNSRLTSVEQYGAVLVNQAGHMDQVHKLSPVWWYMPVVTVAQEGLQKNSECNITIRAKGLKGPGS